MEIYGEKLYMTWDGTPTGLYEYDFENKLDKNISLYETVDKQDGYASFVIENEYQNELEAFINLTHGKGSAEYSFEEDFKILAMIDDIEKGEDGK